MGNLLSLEPAPYLNIRLLRDLCAIGQVVRLCIVLPQQCPAGMRLGMVGPWPLPGGLWQAGDNQRLRAEIADAVTPGVGELTLTVGLPLAHPHSLVLLQPEEVVPAFSTDAVEDAVGVDALHERERTSETCCHQEQELRKRAPTLPRKGMGSTCTPVEGSSGMGSLASHPGGIQQKHRISEGKNCMWAIPQIPAHPQMKNRSPQ